MCGTERTLCSDSMLNGLGLMLLRGVSLPAPSSSSPSPSTLSRRCIEQSSGSSPDSAPPTTSIGSSSSLSLSSSSSESLPELFRCWDRYSAFSASRSTVMPLARSFRACRSSAFAIFFRRRALHGKRRKERKDCGRHRHRFDSADSAATCHLVAVFQARVNTAAAGSKGEKSA
uniref:Uncharacterized protein n=1 Tax=Anopheles merus TaxID=30066 RepID=A0A182V948_ANOME